MERGLVANESSLPYRAVPAAALRGRAPWVVARNLLTLARGTLAAARLIRELRPAAILGTGGYVCVPLFVAARLARVPTVAYLPDVVPGLAIRLLARLATVVAANVPDSARYLRFTIDDRYQNAVQSRSVRPIVVNRSQLYVVGYPVRAELFNHDRAMCRAAFGLVPELPVLLVYGGSRGARTINQAVAALLEPLLRLAQVIHVCGREGDQQWLRAAAERLPTGLQQRYKLFAYLGGGEDRETRKQQTGDSRQETADKRQQTRDEGIGGTESTGLGSRVAGRGSDRFSASPTMIRAFGAADLALCRSGASTLAELPAAGLPAVLVPYPYVHQDENADYLVRHGAAVKVADSAMLGKRAPTDGPLWRELRRLLSNQDERLQMAERSRVLARPAAAQQLAELVLALATRKGPL